MARILITDLTQMTGNRLCVAGFNEKMECVRIDLRYPGILKHHLYKNDQVLIRPRAVLNIDIHPKNNCRAPHVEDHDWLNPANTDVEKILDELQWKNILDKTLTEPVETLFGTPISKHHTAEAWTGTRSLGTIKPSLIAKFRYMKDEFQPSGFRCRLDFVDTDDKYYAVIPIVDLAMIYYANYLNFNEHMSPEEIETHLKRVLRSREVWLRLGLTRPWRNEQGKTASYLQITGIHTFPDYLEGKCFADYDF